MSRGVLWALVCGLAACGGGGGPSADGETSASAEEAESIRTHDAFRLADQATFGATEALIEEIRTLGAGPWVQAQMGLATSRYTFGRGDLIHLDASPASFCNRPENIGPHCKRDWYSTVPLAWNFYRNALGQPDQLRQRVAFALQQIVVVSNIEVGGTYGYRNFHNAMLAHALGNYRDVLKSAALSPVMGDFLDHVNNRALAPNENFARELLQLFSIGTCELETDGALKGGACVPTYSNETVRHYAYALTGWTYPAGGGASWGCWPLGANCQYYGGDMVPVESFHDVEPRPLLAGVTVPAQSSTAQALDRVLDSLLAHPNTAPFIGRQLIQHLVTSNPSPAYVQRVSAAFATGRHRHGSLDFGRGQRGDLAATVAAVLLDTEARSATTSRSAGKLREPVLMFTAVLRALHGRTDGDALATEWGALLHQDLFRAPSVFSFYPPDFPVAGTSHVGPAFGIHSEDAALSRLNFLGFLIYAGGASAQPTVPEATGTQIDTQPFEADAADPAKLVDRLSALATGERLPEPARTQIVEAVAACEVQPGSPWQAERVRQAAYLVFATPAFQVQH